MKLGVFDSGRGGEAVSASLRLTFPEAEIITVNDHKNVPYGSKTTEQIAYLTNQAIQPLLKIGCDIIIIACNTATAAAIRQLRQLYPFQSFIGFEPMIKPAAALTKTGVIAVCATPSTLASDSYRSLVERFGNGVNIIEPDCSQWAPMIENNNLDESLIEKTIEYCCSQKADVIVLACTHYHWIKDLINSVAGSRAIALEPTNAIARRINQIMNTVAKPLNA